MSSALAASARTRGRRRRRRWHRTDPHRRIGVWRDGGLLPGSAALVAEALGELLDRFWYAIDAGGARAGDA